MKLMRLLLLLLLLVSLTSSAVFATPLIPDSDHDDSEETDDESDETEDSDDDGIDDETEEDYEREVEVNQGDREWKIESELKNGEQKDEFLAEFKVGGGDEPEIELEYKTEANATESAMKYRVNFDEIIEFTDDGQAGYQEGNDTVVSVYDLGKQDWEAIVYNIETVDNSTLYTANATTSDGVFTLILKLSTGFVNVNNTVVTPNAIKIDVIINNYNYSGTGTYLTLQTDIKTEAETEVDEESDDEKKGYAQNETQVSISTAAAAGFFSWVEIAEADNSTVDVISSNLVDVDEQDDDLEEGENQKIVFFTFDAQNPEEIIWDPKVGVDNDVVVQSNTQTTQTSSESDEVEDSTPVTSDRSLPLPVLALLLSLAIPVWYRRRQ